MSRSNFSDYSSSEQLIVGLVSAGWQKATEEDLEAFSAENYFCAHAWTCPYCTATHQELTLCPNKSMDGDYLGLMVAVRKNGSFGDWSLFECYTGTTTGYTQVT